MKVACPPGMSKHESAWQAALPPSRAPLLDNIRTDVCVVGAGIAGLTTAYLLARAGRKVVVLDDGPIGAGMTQMTSGHLTCMLDDRYFELERVHGTHGARLAAESHAAAIDRIEANVAEERIDCDFARVEGYLFLAAGDRVETLDKELAAAHRAGLSGVQKRERAPFSSFDSGPCLCIPRQARLHALKYLAGLAAAIERLGGRIFTGTHVTAVEGGSPAI